MLTRTVRSPIVREGELVDVFREQPDLYAGLGLTNPEPPFPLRGYAIF